MGSLHELLGILRGVEISVPATEMMMLLAALTLCLVFRCTRSGLLLSFVGTYHWGWMVFQREFSHTFPVFLYTYFALGVAVVVLSILTWMFAEE